MQKINQLSIHQLHRKILSREIKPSEMLEIFIKQIEEVNPRLNAIVAHDFARARQRAKQLDEEINQHQTLSPIYGLPFTTKEMVQVEGFPHSVGLMRQKQQRATKTATVVKRLEDAGAICIGVTNIPELGLWFETSNLVYGRTNNPYKLSRTCGGSSGGEAAIIASGGVAFGIGSDVGGSIRIPAFFCGLFGHKPSPHLVPFTGHYPVYHDDVEHFKGDAYPLTVMGPMARSGRDLVTLLEIISGPDQLDPKTKKTFQFTGSTSEFSRDLWKDRKVYVCDNLNLWGARSVSPDLQHSVTVAAQVLSDYGAKIERLDGHLFHRAFDMWSSVVGNVKGQNLISRLSDPVKGFSLFHEFLLWIMRRPHHTWPILSAAFAEKYLQSPKHLEKFLIQAENLRVKMLEILRPNNILIFPPHSRPAPKHNEPILHPFDFAYTGVFNALRLPVTQVPLGLNAEGLPLGVQIVAAEDSDHIGLEAAMLLDESVRGYNGPRLVMPLT